MFVEEEGLTLVIERSVAEGNRIDCSAPFRRIVLTVHSSLEAVGLTAAVATALAERGISANMIAAFHHDHIFVPSDRAEAALAALHACQKAGVGYAAWADNSSRSPDAFAGQRDP